MKRSITLVVFCLWSAIFWAQDTLRHFDPLVDVPVADEFNEDRGCFTGHNTFGDEEFGEKYRIDGSVEVIGIMAIHSGIEGMSPMNAQYRVYEVSSNGLRSLRY